MAGQQQRQGRRFQGGGGAKQDRPVDASKGQVGNTWIGERPSGEEFATWFTENVKIHEGLDHADYIGGVVLIEQNGKVKKTVENSDQSGHTIQEFARLEYTPYAKVDVRMKYLWDLCEVKGNWLGVVEPAGVPRVEATGYTNVHLPEGFFRHQAEVEGAWVQFIACAMRVSIYDVNRVRVVEYEDKITGEPKQKIIGIPIKVAAPATKMVPVINYGKVDPFSLMKAETGAVGRALGMAGMLVIPGSGIATAEDVQEAQELPGRAITATAAETSADALPEVEGGEDVAEPAALPEPPADGTPPADAPAEEGKPPAETKEDLEAASDDRLRELVERDLLALRDDYPEAYATMKAWWEEDRKLGELNRASIQALQQPMLRGVTRKVRKTLEEARQAAAAGKVAEALADGAAEPEPASKSEAAEPAAQSPPADEPPAGASE